MTSRAAERGQPLVMLGVLLGGWIVLRTALWQSPFPELAPLAAQPPQGQPVLATLQDVSTGSPGIPPGQILTTRLAEPWPFPRAAEPLEPPAIGGAVPEDSPPAPMMLHFTAGPGPSVGLANLNLAPGLLRDHAPLFRREPAAAPFHPDTAIATSPDAGPWSADAWLLLRRDSATAVTSGRGSYGRSQLGAVLRYRLWPSSAHRPAAYLRASEALAGPRESEAALGLSARPLPRVPVALAGEMRLSRAGGATQVRPAAYAVTELPPLDLPGGVTAEAYLQAGYVGGRFATGFVDGQVRAERILFDLGSAELRAGGGVWGGAQQGASRLDIGPGATLKLAIGRAAARASFDWRFRVAGTAEPASGPALTISAGF